MIEIYRNFFRNRRLLPLIGMLVLMIGMPIYSYTSAHGLFEKIFLPSVAVALWWIFMPCFIYFVDHRRDKGQA